MKPVIVQTRVVDEKLEYQDVTMVKVSISYPEIGGDIPKLCARRFNDYWAREATGLRKNARQELYGSAVEDYEYSRQKGYPFNPYELMQVFEVTFNSVPILSLYADVYQYTGGAHGMTDRTGSTWDVQRCRMLEMRDLFGRGYDYTTPILKYIPAEAARRQASEEASYFEGLEQNIRKYFDEKNFYLSCQGLNVYYPLYSIAPYYVGIQVFTVPYGMFGNHLAYPLPALCM